MIFSKLPVHSDLSTVSDLSRYSRIPDDWFVVSADIKNSTGAIKAGNEVYVARYEMSKHCNQSAFTGVSTKYVENLIKNNEKRGNIVLASIFIL
tara:strand:+ start:9089 stop:9370 length:282 start_codon:yes stop_codon:yes gene_type:complete